MDFYEKLTIEKAIKKLSNKDLGALIDMKSEAFRMAVNRKSLSNLQIKEIEKFFDIEQEPKKTPSNENASKMVAEMAQKYAELIEKKLDYFMLKYERMEKELEMERSKNNKN